MRKIWELYSENLKGLFVIAKLDEEGNVHALHLYSVGLQLH